MEGSSKGERALQCAEMDEAGIVKLGLASYLLRATDLN